MKCFIVLLASLMVFMLAACQRTPSTAEEAPPPPERLIPGTEGQSWVLVLEATPVYSPRGDVLAIAPLGSWFRVVDSSPGWVLAVPDESDRAPVWITVDARIQITAGRVRDTH